MKQPQLPCQRLLLLAALAAGCGSPSTGPGASSRAQEEVIIARVDGERVTLGLFEAYLRDNLNVSDEPHPGARDNLRSGLEAAQANAMTDEVKSRLLDRFLLEQALFLKASEAGIEATEEALDAFSRAVGLGPLQSLHEGAPFTEREYLRQYLSNCYVVKRYLDTVVLAKIAAEPSEAEAYYRRHAARFSSPDRYRLRLIRVDTMPEAQSLLRKIGTDGATFLTVAAGLSGGIEGEGDQGKDLGMWLASELPEPFAAALAPLAKGSVSGVVQDPEGLYNLLYLEDKIPGDSVPFESVKDRLLAQVTREKRDQALAAFLADLRQQSKIEIEAGALGFRYVDRAAAEASPAPPDPVPTGSEAAPAASSAPPSPGGAS